MFWKFQVISIALFLNAICCDPISQISRQFHQSLNYNVTGNQSCGTDFSYIRGKKINDIKKNKYKVFIFSKVNLVYFSFPRIQKTAICCNMTRSFSTTILTRYTELVLIVVSSGSISIISRYSWVLSCSVSEILLMAECCVLSSITLCISALNSFAVR